MALAQQWLEALIAKLPEDPYRIFPDRTLLDHVPLMLRRMASATTDQSIVESVGIRQELEQLAELRRSQGYGVDEVAREFLLLSDIVLDFVQEKSELTELPPTRDAVAVVRNLQGALMRMSTMAMESFDRGDRADRHERAHLLESFGRAVTHELRNRLNGVTIALGLLELTALADDKESVSKLRNKLKNVEQVVEDVFAVAIAHGRDAPGEHSFRPLRDVIKECIADAEDYAEARGVALRTSNELPLFAVDAMRVKLILVNLLSNAIKYSDPGRRDRTVSIDAKPSADRMWTVTVNDNGVGIEGAELTRIFERYHRASTPLDVEGQGIGLSLANEAMAQLGGHIEVESRAGEGSVFSFSLREPAEALLDEV